MSLFRSYLLRLIPVWVTGTAPSGGYETLQHLTGGVKRVLSPHLYADAGIASLQLFSRCAPGPSESFSFKVRVFLCRRSRTSRPKWTPWRAPNLRRLLLLPASCLWLEEDHLSRSPPPDCERSHPICHPEPCTPHNAPGVSSQQVTRAPTTWQRFTAGGRLLLPLGTVISPEVRHKVLFQTAAGGRSIDCWTSSFLFCGLDENPPCEFHVIKPAEEERWWPQTSHLHLQLLILRDSSGKRDGRAAAACCMYILHPCLR